MKVPTVRKTAAGLPDSEVNMHVTLTSLSKKFWDDWGYGTGRVKDPQNSGTEIAEEIQLSGELRGLPVGSVLMLTGTWAEHDKYGVQFKVKSAVELDDPNNEDAIVSWLDHRLPWVGPVRAERLWMLFGEQLWEVIETRPEELEQIEGITTERALEIQAAYREYKHEREIIIKLLSAGFEPTEAKGAFSRYGKQTIDVIKTDPYRLCLEGVMAFRRCDGFARRVRRREFDPSDPKRLLAACLMVAREVTFDTGSTLLRLPDLAERVSQELSMRTEYASKALSLEIDAGTYLCWYGDGVMLAEHNKAEEDLTRFVCGREGGQ
jgi:exodeoxyribonuclease V alpha subunit